MSFVVSFTFKVQFAHAGESAQSQLCDNFLGYAELLKILMVNKCERQQLVSLQELASKDKARRLRDGLIEDHQFSLAMEVATKCQVGGRLDKWKMCRGPASITTASSAPSVLPPSA